MFAIMFTADTIIAGCALLGVAGGIGTGVGRYTRNIIKRRKDERAEEQERQIKERLRMERMEQALAGTLETEFTARQPGVIEQVTNLATVVAKLVERQAEHERVDADLAQVFWGHTNHPPTPSVPQRRAV